jgi:hypothetical protein
MGKYSLSVRDDRTRLSRELVAPDTPVAGRFDRNAPMLDARSAYAVYRLEGQKGDRFDIEMRSPTEGMEPRLQLWRETDATYAAESRPGAGPAQMLVLLPSAATYFIYAIGSKIPGDYELEVKRMNRVETPTQSLSAGAQIEADLAASDGAMTAGSPQIVSFYKMFELPVQAGEALSIKVSSPDFDPVLQAGVQSPIGFAAARTNDDARNGSTDSQIDLVGSESGLILLRVKSVNAGTGRFSLSVGAPPPEPAEP